MAIQKPRYSKEEFARRGTDLYERHIRAQVEQGNKGRIVAIDIDTGDYELGDDLLAASNRLRSRKPDAQTWFVRVGSRAVHRFGSQRQREQA